MNAFSHLTYASEFDYKSLQYLDLAWFLFFLFSVIKVWDMRKISYKNTTDPIALFNFPYAGKSKRTHGKYKFDF